MLLQEAVAKYFVGAGGLLPVHRIALFDSAGNIDTVISQMDVVRYIYARSPDTAWCKATLAESGAL
jgi:hypothetical protein